VRNALLIKRQAEAAADFAGAMKLMASEVGKLYGQADLAKTQVDWEKALAQSQSMEERMEMFLDSIQEGAAADVSSAAAGEAISDAEIDALIEAEQRVEAARDQQQMSALRAELNALKGEPGGSTETK
jgi:hypothetical protein